MTHRNDRIISLETLGSADADDEDDEPLLGSAISSFSSLSPSLGKDKAKAKRKATVAMFVNASPSSSDEDLLECAADTGSRAVNRGAADADAMAIPLMLRNVRNDKVLRMPEEIDARRLEVTKDKPVTHR